MSQYAEFFALPRFYTLADGSVGKSRLLIAAVGLYGVLAYAIAQQTREFGVRLALGAQKADIVRMVLRNGSIVTALGLIAGVAGSVPIQDHRVHRAIVAIVTTPSARTPNRAHAINSTTL